MGRIRLFFALVRMFVRNAAALAIVFCQFRADAALECSAE